MVRMLVVMVLCLWAAGAQAQQCGGLRYQQRVFGQSFKTSNVVYANAPSLPTTLYLGENVTQNVDLTLDVYQPFGDTLQRRPLVILAFGGAFLIGSKDDEDIQSVSDSLARRGYVTACINYRLGMNVADGVSAERAIYRSLQDFSAAVRYFKEFADLYRIDTNYIYVGGVSAGGFAALHMALVEESDRPASSFAAGGINPRPDLGCKDCSGNNYPHTSDVRGIINYWGAIGDVNWIKPGKTKPLVSFHGDQDLIVPYNTGYPFTALAILPQVSGSGAIKQRYDQIGGYNQHYKIAGEGHNIWGLMVMNQFTPGPNQYYLPIYNGTAEFLFEHSRPELPAIQGNDTVCPGVVSVYTVPAVAGARYCWGIDGGQITSINANQIEVQWHTPGMGQLYATSINHLDAVSPTDTFSVWVHTPFMVNLVSPDGNSVCSGGYLPLHSAVVAAQYQWLPPQFYSNASVDSTVLTPIISGLYYLQAADSLGCVGRDSVYISVLPSPPAPTVSQAGDTLMATSSGGTINWYDGDSNYMASGSSFQPPANGIYFANETAANGCESIWTGVAYLSTGVVNDVSGGVAIYPNPFNDRVVVESPQGGTITIYNAAGALVAAQPIGSPQAIIHFSALPSGVYFYRLATATGVLHGKLLKQ